MHQEADYAQAYKDDMDAFGSLDRLTPEQKEVLHEDMKKIIEIADLSNSQFQRVLNEKKRKKVLMLYRILDEEAQATGSRISLDIDDERMVADLSYAGNLICKTASEDTRIGQAMAFLALESDMFEISANENKTFTLHAKIDFFDQVQVADCSKELEQMKMKLKEWNQVKWNDVPKPKF